MRIHLHESETGAPRLRYCDRQSASRIRRTEVDAWLEEVGAHTIRVTDLGAALEARELGFLCLRQVDRQAPPEMGRIDPVDFSAIPYWASRAAHLARKALGEVGR